MVAIQALLLTFLIFVCHGFEATPFLLASHKLVRGIKPVEPELEVNSVKHVTDLTKQLITSCSSDEYVIVNFPGLKMEDMTNRKMGNWRHLVKYLHMASTVVGIPWVDDVIDLDHLEKYIIKTCNAETVNVWYDENEVDYIDTRTRVIRVQMSELPEDPRERDETIRSNDELLRKVLRKLPSPHYTLIITSDKLSSNHFIPDVIKEMHPEKFRIFEEITHDPRRQFEVERNDRFHKIEPDFAKPRNTNDRYLANKKRDEIHLFNLELWQKNEKLIFTLIIMVATLVFMKLTSILKYICRVFFKQKGSNGSIIENGRKKYD